MPDELRAVLGPSAMLFLLCSPAESSEGPPGLKGAEIRTLPLDWRVSRSHCKRTRGVEESVATIFGKYNQPHFFLPISSAALSAVTPQIRVLWD